MHRTIRDAAWLHDATVKALFDALGGDSDTVRAVGGAVRDTLLGRPVGEIDFATTLLPETVAERATAAGIRAVPTGLEHGTLTLICHGRSFEVTTLRQDVVTDGRHAIVHFGTDWRADAQRRDFTINALSADRHGTVYDPVGGLADLAERRVRFIGNPRRRIAEDRLRILRFFRFQATIGSGQIDADGLSAAIAERNGLRNLSAERIGQEIRRLVIGPGAAETARIMQDAGLLTIVLGGVCYIARFSRYQSVQAAIGAKPAAERALVALSAVLPEDVERLFERLRLSSASRNRMLAGLAAADLVGIGTDDRTARALLYRLGEPCFRDGVLLAASVDGNKSNVAKHWKQLFDLPDHWQVPIFPLKGSDVVALGQAPGPAVGRLLRQLEEWWIGEDFRPDVDSLRRRLRQDLSGSGN